MIGAFRNRLFHLDTQEKQWDYFVKNAGYYENEDVYGIAGIFSSDTSNLWEKFQRECYDDLMFEAKRQLSAGAGIR